MSGLPKSGTMGLGDTKDGSKGADLILPVPVGTVIFEAKGPQGKPKHPGEQLADLRHAGDKFVVAAGGNGGACHAQIYTMGTVLRHGSAAQKARYLPEIAAGRLRLQRFVRTLTQVAGKYGRRADALESADLRYEDGYALRLKGVTTGSSAPAAAGAARSAQARPAQARPAFPG